MIPTLFFFTIYVPYVAYRERLSALRESSLMIAAMTKCIIIVLSKILFISSLSTLQNRLYRTNFYIST